MLEPWTPPTGVITANTITATYSGSGSPIIAATITVPPGRWMIVGYAGGTTGVAANGVVSVGISQGAGAVSAVVNSSFGSGPIGSQVIATSPPLFATILPSQGPTVYNVLLYTSGGVSVAGPASISAVPLP